MVHQRFVEQSVPLVRHRQTVLPNRSPTICGTKRTPPSPQTNSSSPSFTNDLRNEAYSSFATSKQFFPMVHQRFVEQSVPLVRHRQTVLLHRSPTICGTKRTPPSPQTNSSSQSFTNDLWNEAYSSFATSKQFFPMVHQRFVEQSVPLVRHRQTVLPHRSPTICGTKRTPPSPQTNSSSPSFTNDLWNEAYSSFATSKQFFTMVHQRFVEQSVPLVRHRQTVLPHRSPTICGTKRTPRSPQANSSSPWFTNDLWNEAYPSFATSKQFFPIVHQRFVERSVLLVRHKQTILPHGSPTICRTKRTPRSPQTNGSSPSFTNDLWNEAYSSFATDKQFFPIVHQRFEERSVLLVRLKQTVLPHGSPTICRTKRTPRSPQTNSSSPSFTNDLWNEAYSSFATDKQFFPIVHQRFVERSVLLLRHRQTVLPHRSPTICGTKRTPRSPQANNSSPWFTNDL